MRIIEECGCGARIEFDKRTRQTYAEQDRADQQFLTQFRNEHSCSLRAPENVEEPKLGISTPKSKFCDYCGRGGVLDGFIADNCPHCTPENVECPSD